MKNVLVFGMTENPGGVESVIMNYYRAMDRSRVQLDFLCNSDTVAYEEEILALGGTVYKIPARRDGRRAFHQALDAFMAQHAREYCAIWVNVCSLANIDYLKAAKKYGIPKRIIHCHNAANGDSFLRGLLHRYNRRVVRGVATDFWSCSDGACPWFYGAEAGKLPHYQLITNAIDPAQFTPDPQVRQAYRRQLGCEDALVVGHVGRFHFQKNQSFLLDVVSELAHMGQPVKALLVGQGEDLEPMREKARSLGLEGQVEFLGVRSDTAQLYQAMDVFVFPSQFEGLPMALLEAQANGLPCVVSDAIVPEIQVNPNLYRLSLQDSPKQWAECVVNKALKAGRVDQTQFAHSPYDINSQVQRLQALLTEAAL